MGTFGGCSQGAHTVQCMGQICCETSGQRIRCPVLRLANLQLKLSLCLVETMLLQQPIADSACRADLRGQHRAQQKSLPLSWGSAALQPGVTQRGADLRAAPSSARKRASPSALAVQSLQPDVSASKATASPICSCIVPQALCCLPKDPAGTITSSSASEPCSMPDQVSAFLAQ